MADFCKECSIEVFGEDFGDLKGLCDEGYMSLAICEGGCGDEVHMIFVDHNGVRVDQES